MIQLILVKWEEWGKFTTTIVNNRNEIILKSKLKMK